MVSNFFIICVIAVSLITTITGQDDADQPSASERFISNGSSNASIHKPAEEDAVPSNTKFIKPQVLSALIQPFQEKLGALVNSLTQPEHPNNPHFFNPLKIWEKVQENGNKFFAGLQHALGHSQNTDYPVPFRTARSKPVTFIN